MKCLLCGGETEGMYIGRHWRCLACRFQWWEQTEILGFGYIFGNEEVEEVPLGCLSVLPGEERV